MRQHESYHVDEIHGIQRSKNNSQDAKQPFNVRNIPSKNQEQQQHTK